MFAFVRRWTVVACALALFARAETLGQVSRQKDAAVQKRAERLQTAIRRADEAQQAEVEKIRRLLKTIHDLQKAGDATDASQMVRELQRLIPDHPGTTASNRINSIADQLAADRRLKDERQIKVASVMRDIERSAMPIDSDITFPKDWKKRTRGRSSQTPLTPKENAILKSLDTPISVKFKDSRLEDVIQYLATVMDQPIVIDKAALDEAGVNYHTPITLQIKSLSARLVLRKILAEFGLAYIVKEQVIQVTSAQKARSTLTTRTYYIGDLLFSDLGPWSDLQKYLSARQIVNLIQTTIDPGSWQANGGQGTIVYDPISQAIIVKQGAEVHSMFGKK